MPYNIPEIEDALVQILTEMVQDWDVDSEDPISPQTELVADLGFSSIDIIHFTVAVESHFHRPKLGFNELLMVDGKYVEDLSIAQVAVFLQRKLNSSS